jgi:hypothetical protein
MSMKSSSLDNSKAFHYFLLAFILLLGILAIYVSCKSKSPTEATSSLPNQISTQSTNNTTTSSSTTTSVKPGQSPTNTTTLITSRYLTTTSTRTTTSSSSTTSTTTTSRKPTITSTTTSVGSPRLEWCAFDVESYDGTIWIWFTVNNGDIIDECRGEIVFALFFKMKNVGTAPAENVTVTIQSVTPSPGSYFTVYDDTAFLGTIPADGACMPLSNNEIIISWGLPNPTMPGDQAVFTFVESFSNKTFTLTIRCPS